MYPDHSNAYIHDFELAQREPALPMEHSSHLTTQHATFPPLSFETDDDADTGSTSLADIIEGLPTAVKSSLGPLRTIRQSVSIRSWVSYFCEISNGCTTSTVAHEEHTESHHTVVSTSAAGLEMHHQQMNSSQKRRRTSSIRTISDSRPCAQAASTDLVACPDVPQQQCTIDRFCGNQGQQLISNALATSENQNERRAYVQGVAWLIQGLPADLDSRERHELESAIYRRVPTARRHMIAARRADAIRQRSFIHHFVAQLVVPLQLMWAYFVALLAQAIQLERKHKVTEQVIRCSGELGYTVGKSGLKLSEAVYNNGGAKVCAMVVTLATYVADEVVKGISDGIRESRRGLQEDEYR